MTAPRRLPLALCAVLAAPPAAGQDSAPLSAIDWLDRALAVPEGPAAPPATTPPVRTPLAARGTAIDRRALPAPSVDGTGLFPARRAGLERGLWGRTPLPVLTAALERLGPDTVPAAQQLALRVLTAELAPPRAADPGTPGGWLRARVERLIALGAVQQADRLLRAAPRHNAALAARAFDVALLLGADDRACAGLRGRIANHDLQGARIFCLARGGDWPAALVALQAARALGVLPQGQGVLLDRFLREEDGDLALPPPRALSVLDWRLLDALGDPVGTAGLPLAFAHADLRGTAGWRAQLDAAERLARAGVLDPERLLGLYTRRAPAASGSVWERVRAVQALDAALRDGAGAGDALRAAWLRFRDAELESAFAQIFADRLAARPLDGAAQGVQWRVLMLAGRAPDGIAPPDNARARSAAALAGVATGLAPDAGAMATALAGALNGPPRLDDARALWLDEGAQGRLLLDALAHVADGAAGDARAAGAGVAALRALGLDGPARQIAVELLLLDRRG